jgi:hypothetical protein
MNEFTLNFQIRRASPPAPTPGPAAPGKAAAKGGKA